MKKLMVLGASYSQIPLIRAAKRRGLHVIAASIPGNYAGFAEADEIAYADITDPDAVLEAAKKAGIDGITTCCMDVGTYAMGYVCEKMGLPGPGILAVRASSDKSVEKQLYEQHGVPTAKFRIVRERSEVREALKDLTMPVMVKAVDLMGSRGIRKAETPEEAEEAFDLAMQATGKDFCIIEEFIDGTMFGVEAMIDGDELSYCLPLGNDMKGGNPSFPTGHYVPWSPDPARAEEVYEQIRDVTERAARALGFRHCAMDLDCMWKDGRIYVIEATCRAGATCITDTVSIYYGFDYFEAIVRAALGEETESCFRGDQVPRMPSVTKLLASSAEGVVERICRPADLPENVTDLSFNVAPGDSVRQMENGRDRIGQLIVKGSSVRMCRETIENVLAKTTLILRDGREVKVC